MARIATEWGEVDLPAGHLSPTQIDLYVVACPLAYYRKYVLRQEEVWPLQLSFGISVHEALAATNRSKIAGDGYLPTGALMEAFAASFDGEQDRIDDWQGWNRDEVDKAARAGLTTYAKKEQDKHEPVQAEEWIKGSIAGVPVVGRLDMVEGLGKKRRAMVDYKTSSRAVSQNALQSDSQMGIYSRITGMRDVSIVTLNRDSGAVTPTKAVLSGSFVSWVDVVVRRVASSITAGAFPPCDPGHWKCTARYCGFWALCRGAGRRRMKPKKV